MSPILFFPSLVSRHCKTDCNSKSIHDETGAISSVCATVHGIKDARCPLRDTEKFAEAENPRAWDQSNPESGVFLMHASGLGNVNGPPLPCACDCEEGLDATWEDLAHACVNRHVMVGEVISYQYKAKASVTSDEDMGCMCGQVVLGATLRMRPLSGRRLAAAGGAHAGDCVGHSDQHRRLGDGSRAAGCPEEGEYARYWSHELLYQACAYWEEDASLCARNTKRAALHAHIEQAHAAGTSLPCKLLEVKAKSKLI